MTRPFVSVIIPTAGRPALLTRAIRSALAGLPAGEVEVIVVPNGLDESWRSALRMFEGNASVQTIRLKSASATVARNKGLEVSRGMFIRFLDDDDYLLPENAVQQYEALERTGSDVCSGSIRIEDEAGGNGDTLVQVATHDFILASLHPDRIPLPHAHVYRRDLISSLRWDPATVHSEDVLWLHAICRHSEVNWLRMEEVVGVWFQHRGPRITLGYAANEPIMATAASTIETIRFLESQGRLDVYRRQAAAAALWKCVHRGFYLSPLYWNWIGRIARHLDPGSGPKLSLYGTRFGRWLHPLLVEWVMLPKRSLNHWFRSFRGKLFGWDYRRTL